MKIRQAKMEDAQAIAKVHVASWKTTYAGIIKKEILEQVTVETRTLLWQKNLSLKENPYISLVMENDEGTVIGFATGAAVTRQEYPYDGDVTSIYFYESYQGRGLGKQLLFALFSEFKKEGYQNAIVKVLAANKAKYFYEKMGAKEIHRSDVPDYGEGNVLIVYAWEAL